MAVLSDWILGARKSRPARRPRLPRCVMLEQIEPLEERLVLHANVVMDAEHLAVFGARDPVTQVVTGGLVPDSAVTDRAIASGNWSDPTIWSNGIPKDGDNVLIGAGFVVTIDCDASIDASNNRVALRTIRDDGTLRFQADVNTTLLVDTIIVEPSGTYEMGTADDPIDAAHRARVIFADREAGLDAAGQAAFEAARRAWDPLAFSEGLVSHGDVSIYGSNVTSYVLATKNLNANSTTIDLGVPVPSDWKVGDRLIVTGSTPTNSMGLNQDEQVQIAGISGNVITLKASTPIKYLHTINATYVANVTRNATFESENVQVVARHGHVMFMHNDDVHVAAAGFYGLGRTDKRRVIDDPVNQPDPDHPGQMTTDVLLANVNSEHPEIGHRVLVPVVDGNGKVVIDPATGKPKLQIAQTGLNPRGRYAVHFHRTGLTSTDDPATLDDCAVVDSPGWGIVNHSSNVDITNNVVFNAVGAAYVTEAGDEIGTFQHNIAIHSLGSGEDLESRKNINDFGHEGDGFWLQGGNVSLIDNVASGQRHSGYVFFPLGLTQKGLGITTIPGSTLSYSWADPTKNYDVADIPLKQFIGNVAFASQDGFESWFSLLNTTHTDRSVIQNFKVFSTTDHGIFTPYTNLMTFQNVTVMGNMGNPSNTGFDRNSITKNITYDHVNVQGWGVGIAAPLQGVNNIIGGKFNNLQNIYVTTSSSRDRVVNINDASATDPVQFLDNMKTFVNGVLTPRKQWDIYLQTNFQPLMNDITRNFSPDVIQMGLVSHNGQQVYYYEQAADYTPYPSLDHGTSTKFGPKAASFVPAALQDKTNAQLMAQYGLAIGGIVAPADATTDPLINGLVGAKATYLPDIYVWSPKYFNDSNGTYKLIYSYYDPAKHSYQYVSESTHTPLVQGWNLITRTILGQTRTMLIYGDNIPPTLVLSANSPTTLNQADLDNGTMLNLSGDIVDDSTGSTHFTMSIKLNDPSAVSVQKTRPDGSKYVTITFAIRDQAGNTTIIHLDFTVQLSAILIKDQGQKYLPLIDPSATLVALVGHS